MSKFKSLVKEIKSSYGDEVYISEKIAKEESLLHTVAVITFVNDLTSIFDEMDLGNLSPIILIEESKKTYSELPNFDFYFVDPYGNQILDSFPHTPKVYSVNKENISKVWKLFRKVSPNIDTLCLDFDSDSALQIQLTNSSESNIDLLLSKMLSKDQIMFLEKEKLEMDLNVSTSKSKKLKV